MVLLLLFLITFDALMLVIFRGSRLARYFLDGIMTFTAALFCYIAFCYTIAGWPGTVMKVLASVCAVLAFVYPWLRHRPK